MSSSSPRRPRWLAAGALAAVAGALVWAGPAGAATTLKIAAVVPGDRSVRMVVGVDPAPSLAQPGTFQVTSGDSGKLPTDARPVLGPQLAAASVLDTSTAGADALQAGVNGVTSLLLQFPDGVRNLVVSDGGDGPRTLSPLTQGATGAVAALSPVSAGGTRHTRAALDAAVAGLPPEAGRSRLVLLYTGATDAGEPADQLGRRLAAAGVVLAVVSTAADESYWSNAAALTGGVVVPTGGDASPKPFDRLAAELRGRFVLTFPRPATLPSQVKVSLTVAGETVAQSAMVPEAAAETTSPEPADSGSSGPWWWVAAAVVLLALIAGGLFLWLRRRRSADAEPADAWAAREPGLVYRPAPEPFSSDDAWPLPRRRPANGTSAIAARSAAGAAGEPDPSSPDIEPTTADPTALDRTAVNGTAGDPSAGDRTPTTGDPTAGSRPAGERGAGDPAAEDRTAGPTAADPTAGTRAGASRAGGDPTAGSRGGGSRTAAERAAEMTAADRAAAAAAERAGVGRVVGDPAGAAPAGHSTLPRRRPGGNASRRGRGVDDQTVEITRPRTAIPAQHPAADERAFSRLDDETARVATAVAAGTMDFRHAVARIAMAAPGRVDLLDRVLETERRMEGVQIGNAPPSDVTIRLLTVARRVVAGEVALVGPAGVRIEQASSVLRLIHPDRTTHEYRSAKELSRDVDLGTLSVDAS
jgi:hypothetical protein